MKKVAFVTGSSRGIGRAIAIRLAKDGYRVIVHGAGNIEKANEVKKVIEANGGVAEVLKANLCNTDETKALVKEELTEFGIIHSTLEMETEEETCRDKECVIKENHCGHHHHHHHH